MENQTIEEDRNITKPSETIIIDIVYPPLLIVVGVTFNVLIIIVMRTRHFKERSTSVYMTMGAINDTLSLLICMTTHWLHVTFSGVYDKEKAGWICKFLDFYGWGNCDFGILITTSMTIDRAVAITFPLKKASRNNVRRARIAVGVVTVIVVAKEFHFLIGSDMVDPEQKERLCNVFTSTESYKIFWETVWPWLHFSFLLACFITMTISNSVLIYFVWKSSHRSHFDEVRKASGASISPQKIDHQWRSITPMLIGESCALLVLTFPFTVQTFISGYNPVFYNTIDSRLLFAVTFYMLYTNKCITFVIYIVTGSKFREALKECFILCFKGKSAIRKKRFRENFVKNAMILQSISNGHSFSNGVSSSSSFENYDLQCISNQNYIEDDTNGIFNTRL